MEEQTQDSTSPRRQRKAYSAKYRRTHRKALRAYNHRYYQENRAELLRYGKAYYRASRAGKKQLPKACTLCGQEFTPPSGNQHRCPGCTPICQKQDCPRIGRRLHRSGGADFFSIKNGIGKVKITRFACAPDRADPQGSYHYEYRGPHGEEAIRIPAGNDQELRKQPTRWGRFRFIDRDTGLAVETEYDPENTERSANVSAAQIASWQNPKVAARRKRALGAREVQERRVSTLKKTVATRNTAIARDKAELARLRQLAESVPQRREEPKKAASRKQDAGLADKRKCLVDPILTEKGWSLVDLAKDAQLDYHTVDNFMEGFQTYASTRAKLAKVLGIKPANLP